MNKTRYRAFWVFFCGSRTSTCGSRPNLPRPTSRSGAVKGQEQNRTRNIQQPCQIAKTHCSVASAQCCLVQFLEIQLADWVLQFQPGGSFRGNPLPSKVRTLRIAQRQHMFCKTGFFVCFWAPDKLSSTTTTDVRFFLLGGASLFPNHNITWFSPPPKPTTSLLRHRVGAAGNS